MAVGGDVRHEERRGVVGVERRALLRIGSLACHSPVLVSLTMSKP